MQALVLLVRLIDWINNAVGRGVALLTVVMVINVFAVVVLRYVFSLGWIWMQETYVWMHGIVFMLAAGYTLLHNGHVRIDVFYRTASEKYQAAVNLFGVIFLMLPVIWVIYDKASPYVLRSWKRGESSAEAGGLPGLFLLKSVILAFCLLFALQGISLALRSLLTLLNVKVGPVAGGEHEIPGEGA